MSHRLFSLVGKTAVVTGAGANGGIGHAIALGLAQAGAQLAVSDIDAAGLRRTSEELEALGCEYLEVPGDSAVPAAVEALFAEVDGRFGKLDILVNVPFVFPSRERPHEVSLETWNRMFAVNVTGYFLCVRQALPRMLERGGSIINIGSNAGVSALGRGAFAYSCTKGAIHMMTRELAVEYAGAGIRTNAILPAQTMTPGLQQHLQDPVFRATVLPRIVGGLPKGRLMAPAELVGAAVFLASDAAAGVNGVLLPVDGGNLALNASGTYR